MQLLESRNCVAFMLVACRLQVGLHSQANANAMATSTDKPYEYCLSPSDLISKNRRVKMWCQWRVFERILYCSFWYQIFQNPKWIYVRIICAQAALDEAPSSSVNSSSSADGRCPVEYACSQQTTFSPAIDAHAAPPQEIMRQARHTDVASSDQPQPSPVDAPADIQVSCFTTGRQKY